MSSMSQKVSPTVPNDKIFRRGQERSSPPAPFFMLIFLSAFKLKCDPNGIYEWADMILFRFFIPKIATAALNVDLVTIHFRIFSKMGTLTS